MNKFSIMQRLHECCDPWENGGYYDYMHPNYFIRFIADWILDVKEPLNEDDFWIAALGDLTNTQKNNSENLVNFLKNYKIRGVGGEEINALSNRELLAIKRKESKNVEIFWQFGNGTNGLDNDFLPAAEECIKMIKDIRKQNYVKDAYLLSSCAKPINDTYTWYIKILI